MQISNRLGLHRPNYAIGVSFLPWWKVWLCCSLGAFLTWQLTVFPASAAPPSSSRSSSSAAARLVNSPTDNYIAGMEYADFWQNKRMPLKIFIHPSSDVAGFDSRYPEVFKNACQSWSLATDNMLRFEFTEEEDKADIDVRWTADTSRWNNPPNGPELGLCSPTMLKNEGIDHASIFLLTKNNQRRVGLTAMEWASLHELGHALGLGHSGRNSDVMARAVDVKQIAEDGQKSIEACLPEVKLSARDLTTIKIVYAAKRRLDAIRQQRLDNPRACAELTNEAARQIRAGDSGQAIVFLQEVLNLDSSYTVAKQNLMVAYFNCGVELSNKQHYSEALPLLERSLELGKNVGTAAELIAMRSVQRNCLLSIERERQSPQSTPASTQASYSGRSHVRGSR